MRIIIEVADNGYICEYCGEGPITLGDTPEKMVYSTLEEVFDYLSKTLSGVAIPDIGDKSGSLHSEEDLY